MLARAYWFVTALLLALWLFPHLAMALLAAVALCGVQAIHFGVATRSATSFKVQVRLAYLSLLLLGAWDPLRFLHWVQLVGTSVVVVFDYCFLARCLSLLPWNRSGPFTLDLVRRTFFTPPVRGSIVGAV